MTTVEKPGTAFILSLIGGIFILIGGGVMAMISSYGFGGMMGGYGRYGGMMGPGFGMMGGLSYSFGGMFGIAGIIFGIAVIVSALMLYDNPANHSQWGTAILIFSVLSIFGSAMAGFGIGLVLGLIGGILGITWKPTRIQPKT